MSRNVIANNFPHYKAKGPDGTLHDIIGWETWEEGSIGGTYAVTVEIGSTRSVINTTTGVATLLQELDGGVVTSGASK